LEDNIKVDIWKIESTGAVQGNITVYTENHTKHINTPYAQNSELLIIKAAGAYSHH
jgi:hypothetical protein